MQLYGVQPADIDSVWPTVEPLLLRSLVRVDLLKERGTDSVLRGLKKSLMQCWIAHEDNQVLAVFITQIDFYDHRKVLSIPFVGAEKGTIESWLCALETFKEFARSHDCAVIRGWGRKGWEKVLKPDSVRIEFDIEV